MNKPMRIDEFLVGWEQSGYSWARIVVKAPEDRRWPLILGRRWRRVTPEGFGECIPYLTALNAHPEVLKEKYESAVLNYRKYCDAWKKHES